MDYRLLVNSLSHQDSNLGAGVEQQANLPQQGQNNKENKYNSVGIKKVNKKIELRRLQTSDIHDRDGSMKTPATVYTAGLISTYGLMT